MLSIPKKITSGNLLAVYGFIIYGLQIRESAANRGEEIYEAPC